MSWRNCGPILRPVYEGNRQIRRNIVLRRYIPADFPLDKIKINFINNFYFGREDGPPAREAGGEPRVGAINPGEYAVYDAEGSAHPAS